MKTRRIAICFVVVESFLLSAGGSRSGPGTPSRSCIVRVEPDAGRPGDLITAYGGQLDQARVQDLLLTDGERSALVTIVQQNEVSIRFRIPARLSPGLYRVVILPSGRNSHGIEQSVTLRVL